MCASPAGCAHEGHPGWRTDQLLALAPKWLELEPDIVLLLAGTNDIGQNKTQASALSNMHAIITTLAAARPTAKVYVGTILNMINSFFPQWAARVEAYNAALPALAAQFPAGLVTVVDLNKDTGLCDAPPSTLCCNCNGAGNPSCPPAGYDRVHPTGAGYLKMAAVWAAALQPVVDRWHHV